MELNQLSYQIIKAAINVHKELGPGLLESVYQFTLGQEAARFTDKFQRGCTKRRAMYDLKISQRFLCTRATERSGREKYNSVKSVLCQ